MTKIICTSLIVCGLLIVWLWDAFVSSETGSCDNLQGLPVYGKKLPPLNSEDVEYYVDKWSGTLVARTSTSRESYKKMCSDLDLMIIGYKEDDLSDQFHHSVYERFDLSKNSENLILRAAGDFGDGGRAGVTYLFESDAEDSDLGKLVVYVSL